MDMKSEQPPQYVPPGHFYSPIPSSEDFARAVAARSRTTSFDGIHLKEAQQIALLERLRQYYDNVPFPLEKNERFRFAFRNLSYSWGDAIMLFCMLREIRPRRIVEIGASHTSALILDTNELYFSGAINSNMSPSAISN
jgi:hypothetical protein